MLKLRLKYLFILFLGLGVSSFQYNYAMKDDENDKNFLINNDFTYYFSNSDDSGDSMNDSYEEEDLLQNKKSLPRPDFSKCHDNHIIENNINQQNTYLISNNNDGFETPEKIKQTDSSFGLTPEVNSMILSPFGLKTPTKYIEKTNPIEIFDVFVCNFLKFEKKNAENSLFPLINLLFKVENEKVLFCEYKLSEECFEKLIELCNTDFFKDMYESINKFINHNANAKSYQTSEKQKQHKTLKDKLLMCCKTLKSFTQKFIKNFNKDVISDQIKEVINYLNENGFDGSAVTIDTLLQQKYVSGEKKTKQDTSLMFLEDQLVKLKQEVEFCGKLYDIKVEFQKLAEKFIFCKETKSDEEFLKNIASCFEHIVTHESYKEEYWCLCPYLLGYFFIKNKSLKSIVVSQKMYYDESSFNISFKRSKKRDIYLQKLFDISNKVENNKVIIETISSTPLYYLLCFNMKEQEIDDIVINILDNRYKNVDIRKNYDLFENLIDGLIAIATSQQNEQDKQDQQDKQKLDIKKILEKVYSKIMDKLKTIKLGTFLYSYSYKSFIFCALKLEKVLKKENKDLHNAVLINDDHICSVTFDAGKNKFGGGHLDLSIEDFNQALPVQFELFKKCELGNSKNGVSIVDWFIAKKDENKYCGHKFSHLFPSCVTMKNLYSYCEFLYDQSIKQNPEITILEQSNGEKAYNNVIHSMKALMCEHKGCGVDKNCLKHSETVNTTLQLQYELIDKHGKKELENTIPIIMTAFPSALLYFLRDENGNISLNKELITENTQLQEICKDIYSYKRKGQNIVYDVNSKEPLHENISLTLEQLKKITSNNDNDMEFYRDGKLKKLVKITDGVYIEIFKL